MKILLISPFFPPEVGSASHLYFEMAQALQQRGHEITVLTGVPRYHVVDNRQQYQSRFLIRENYHGLNVIRTFTLDIPWNKMLLRGLDQYVSAFCSGVAGLGLPSFDAALAYSPPLPLALATLALCRLRRRPLAVNVQDLFPQSAIDLGFLQNPHLIRIFRGLESLLFRAADLLVVHSEGNRRYVVERGGKPHRVSVVPNWIDTHAIRPAARQNGLRLSLGLEERFIVSYAGVMGYSQDLDTVLASAALLRDHPEIAFLLVGNGVQKPALVQQARRQNLQNVYFLPMQPKEKYPEILSASDACLVTLRQEVKPRWSPPRSSASWRRAGRLWPASLCRATPPG
jgi:colanic acid biosynthesis glycosyl transferase WcaI